MTFGPGSFLCTNFFVLSLGEQWKFILLPQMRKDTHNCNQSNWTISLNLKKSRWNHKEEERTKAWPWVLPINLLWSILPNLVFSAGGAAHDNGELRRMSEGDPITTYSTAWIETKRAWMTPSAPRLTPASKFLSLSLFHKMHLFVNFRTT